MSSSPDKGQFQGKSPRNSACFLCPSRSLIPTTLFRSAHIRAPLPCHWSLTMKMLRSRQVTQATGLSRMTIYRLEHSGKFPCRRRLSQNSVAWLEADIQAWLNERPAVRLRCRSAAPPRATPESPDLDRSAAAPRASRPIGAGNYEGNN